jgi:ParB-like chromosome segregation protein Spo0J
LGRIRAERKAIEVRPKDGEPRALKTEQLENTPELALDFSKENYDRVKSICVKYGNIIPIIVATTNNGNMFKIIKGHYIFEIMKKLGNNVVNCIVVEQNEEINQEKLSLMVSTVNENMGAMSQGYLIQRIISAANGGMTLEQLSRDVGKSKSWLSKRGSLAKNLSPEIVELVVSKTIPPRTAEEIAKLPKASQNRFASGVLKHKMSKDRVSKLVRLHNGWSASEELRERIIDSPESVNLVETEKTRSPKHVDDNAELSKLMLEVARKIKITVSAMEKAGKGRLSELKEEAENFIGSLEKARMRAKELIKIAADGEA